MRKVAVNDGYCRSRDRLDHLVQGGGGGAASEAFTVLEVGAREGRHCVAGGLNIRGGNDGVSPSSSAACNIMGGTCRRSRSVLRGCGPESLSEPEKVARFEFPRPLEGSSRRR